MDTAELCLELDMWHGTLVTPGTPGTSWTLGGPGPGAIIIGKGPGIVQVDSDLFLKQTVIEVQLYCNEITNPAWMSKDFQSICS